jgi:hypothetical protein
VHGEKADEALEGLAPPGPPAVELGEELPDLVVLGRQQVDGIGGGGGLVAGRR